jgi:hypothetical protein
MNVTEINTTASYRATIWHGHEEIFLVDIPSPMIVPRFFTLFWRGNPTHEHLFNFVRSSFRPGQEWLSTMFFFPRDKVRLEPELLKSFPSERELWTIKSHAEQPRFVRYEVYEREPRKGPIDLIQFSARYVAWATISTPKQAAEGSKNEIGIFTTIEEFESPMMKEQAIQLVRGTIKPEMSNSEIVEAFEGTIEIVKNRIENRWPTALI